MNIEEKINKIISDHLCTDMNSIKSELDLRMDLGADELDIIELVMSIEEEFGLAITDEESDKIITVSDCINTVKAKIKANE